MHWLQSSSLRQPRRNVPGTEGLDEGVAGSASGARLPEGVALMVALGVVDCDGALVGLADDVTLGAMPALGVVDCDGADVELADDVVLGAMAALGVADCDGVLVGLADGVVLGAMVALGVVDCDGALVGVADALGEGASSVSQWSPVNAVLQMHEYPFVASSHVPPFRHSSTSVSQNVQCQPAHKAVAQPAALLAVVIEVPSQGTTRPTPRRAVEDVQAVRRIS